MVASRATQEPTQGHVGGGFAGAVGVFALMALAYGVIPHEWLDVRERVPEWGDNTKFIVQSNENILYHPVPNYPFNIDYPALRDIVVSSIYGVVARLEPHAVRDVAEAPRGRARGAGGARPRPRSAHASAARCSVGASRRGRSPRPLPAAGKGRSDGRNDANPPMPDFAVDYVSSRKSTPRS